MKREDFISWAISKGWKQDNYGNLQKSLDGKEYRFKIQAYSVRHEVKVHHDATEYSPASNDWVKLRSGYFKNLSITKENLLAGMKY